MKIHLAWIVAKRGRAKDPPTSALVDEFLKRTRAYAETSAVESTSEEQLFATIEKLAGRTKPLLILLDSRGKLRSSEEIAELLRAARDNGTQHVVFAIGPANGWSADAKARADELLSLGKITLPHELARVVMAEQIYRAFTILSGHPYHAGH